MAPGTDGVRFDIGVPNFGAAPDDIGLARIAEAVESAGFGGVWVADHVLLPSVVRSRYPHSADGAFFHRDGSPWYEPVTTLAWLAAHTSSVELGIGVSVPALRDPRVLAAQLATLDRLAGGRLVLGVGAGWLREEFDALEIPFADRGRRLDAAIDLMRACWTGAPPGGRYGPFTLPDGMRVLPTPYRRIPVLVGGSSDRALARVVSRGDGWYGAVGADGAGPAALDEVRTRLARACRVASRDPDTITLALRFAVTADVLERGVLEHDVAAYVQRGVERFTFDVAWRSLDGGRRTLERLAELRLAVGAPGRWWSGT